MQSYDEPQRMVTCQNQHPEVSLSQVHNTNKDALLIELDCLATHDANDMLCFKDRIC